MEELNSRGPIIENMNQQKQAKEVSEAIAENSMLSQANEKKILVRSYSRKADDDSSIYRRTDFHVMDLKGDEIDKFCFPSLHCCTWPGSMAVSGSCVYIAGGVFLSDDHLLSLPGHPKDLYMGGACLDFGSSHLGLGWSRIPLPIVDRRVPHFVALNGKIYSFGTCRTCPEVYDPAVGDWTEFSAPVPNFLARCNVEYKSVVPDSANNRILMHLSSGGLVEPALYAFYPDGIGQISHWECISPRFQQRYHISTVADNVLYIHDRKKYRSSIFGAYDLVKATWLDVEWTSPFDDNVHESLAGKWFHAAFPLGPHTLCLAHWIQIDALFPGKISNDTRVSFLKFKVERNGSTIRLVPLSFHAFDLPNTNKVLGFHPV